MLIEKLKIKNLNPSSYNPRKDLKPEDKEYKDIKRSIETFGFVEPIVYNKLTGNVVGGHQRLKVLKDLGVTEVECSIVELSDKDEKALNIALNKISGEWDEALLTDLLKQLDELKSLELTGFDKKEFKDLLKKLDTKEVNSPYTNKIQVPIYEPKNEKPQIKDLYDNTKYLELLKQIESEKNITKEDKEFLKIAALRHIVFNYELIADYYSHSKAETQCLMENSALVIIDFNKAIENGYVKLSKQTLEEYNKDCQDVD